jgi:hypothetical protein
MICQTSSNKVSEKLAGFMSGIVYKLSNFFPLRINRRNRAFKA